MNATRSSTTENALATNASSPWGGWTAVYRLGIAVIGVLILVVSFTLRDHISAVLWSTAAAIGILMVISWLVHFLVERRMRQPLQDLALVLEKMTEGRFDMPLPATTAVAYPGLAESLAKMSMLVAGRMRHLKTERDQLRIVIDSLAEGVIAVDSEQRIILAGGAACRMFGLSEGTALGRPIWELIRNPQLQEWIATALKQSAPIHGEMQIHTPKTRILAMSVARLAGKPAPGAVVVAHDITEIRRLEKVRQEFVANASHELKTPITSIRAYVETLLNGAIDDENHRIKFLNTIDEQAGRLDATVRDLLTLAHIEADDANPTPTPTDIAHIAQRCKEHHRPAADRKSVTVTLHAPETPVIVAIGDEALDTILSNLVDNAIKYTSEEGSVTVSWYADDSQGVIEVEDTGIGIPQKHLNRIFERFYRVDRGRSRDQGGTGLGLAIVKHMVQSADGSIEISSTVGRGTTFTLRFPLAQPS